MIYSFKPVAHNIYLFHEHITYIFRQVFLHNPKKFDDALLVRPEFIPILNSADISIRKPLEEIVLIYHKLTYASKLNLQIALSINNSISNFSDKSIIPIKFDKLDPLISNKLKVFYEKLWDDYAQVNQMKVDFGTVKDHYDKLTDDANCIGIVCPFCGIETFEPSSAKYKEDYDHLLAKADYPFVSINFDLLIPTCEKCNSNEKRKTDTLLNDDGTRREVYYPYDLISFDDLEIKIIPKVSYNTYKLETLLKSVPWDFEIQRAGVLDERLESWDNIYGIKRRYSERLLRLEKEWFYELQATYKKEYNLGISFKKFQDDFMKSAKYQVLISGMGIIKYFYFKFLFSSNNFEMRLFESLT